MSPKLIKKEHQRRWVWVPILVLFYAAYLVGALQIHLPFLIAQWNEHALDQLERSAGYSKPDGFWNRRFQFDQFLNPSWTREFPNPQYLSACVCKDELIALLGNPVELSSPSPSECYRFNLKSNCWTRSPAPSGSCYVVADEEQFWFLPHFNQFSEWNRNRQPFVMNGRPHAAVRPAEDHNLFELIEFVNGHWRRANSYALIPARAAEFYCFQMGGATHSIVIDSGRQKIWHRFGLEMGTEEEALRFDAKIARVINITETNMYDLGWQQYQGPNDLKLDFLRQNWEVLSCRFVDDIPSLLFNIQGNPGDAKNGRFWCQFSDASSGSKLISAPFATRFGRQIAFGFYGFHFQNGLSPDGKAVLVFRDWFDGQMYLIGWDRDQFHLITQTGSPLNWLICTDSVLLYLFAIGIPMLVLMLLSSAYQFFSSPRHFLTSREDAVLASIGFRGISRMIDQVLFFIPLLISVALHPDAAIWWIKTVHSLNSARVEFARISIRNWLLNFQNPAQKGSEFVWTLFSMPFVWWLFVPAILILVGQIIWQGQSGLTIGKWLCGIKVVRTTLRPCGLSRSLLREILLVVDSLCLLSWIPGVLTILMTARCQRSGDFCADTIVISSIAPRNDRL